eukprot:COSAG06_NODE_58374_length_277_cov_0.601124_1_plen_33_part_01
MIRHCTVVAHRWHKHVDQRNLYSAGLQGNVRMS